MPLSNLDSFHITTVTGSIIPDQAGITDAHNHVWIEALPDVSPGGLVLNNFEAISAELIDYKQAGGISILDCQPGGCGRNGTTLKKLSLASGVKLIACTGYHLRKYYPQNQWLFHATMEAASQYFIEELEQHLWESRGEETPARAGFIKIAFEESLEQSPLRLVEAAVEASRVTGAAVQAHTERGLDVERIVQHLLNLGLEPACLVISHIDKRPDIGLHSDLVQAGILLEYDTFYRRKYQPQEHLWPLISRMIEAGFDDGIALATDMAESQFWIHLGGSPGLTGMIQQIIPGLHRIGLEESSIKKLTGKNIAMRLAKLDSFNSKGIERPK